MDIKNKAIKLNSEKSLKQLNKDFKEQYNLLSGYYNILISNLNHYITTYRDLNYYYSCLDVLENLNKPLELFRNHLIDNLKTNTKYLESTTKLDSLPIDLCIKVKNHLIKENEILILFSI